MRKLLLPFLLLGVLSGKAQNSIMFGVDGMMAEGNFKYWNFVPNANFSLGMGEKWSFQVGAGYLFHSQKTKYDLDPISSSTPPSSFYARYKSNGFQLYADFKKYFGVHTIEDGGFYIRFGAGYIPLKSKIKVDNFDSSLYRSYEYEPGYTHESSATIINARVFVGYEREIVDLFKLYVEGGFNLFIGEGMYTAINIGIRKQFLKL